jgi:uncharacterized damage-inducible protein DinB
VTVPLDHVLRHNAWANRTLLEHCAELEPAALELEAAGTYGSLYGTLQHLVGAEQWYVSLLTGEMLGTPIRKTVRRSLDDLMKVAALTGERALAIAARDDADRTVEVDGPDDPSTVGTILAQLVNHSNEHRGHATTILSVNGRTTPVISGWRYGIANRISKHDGDD